MKSDVRNKRQHRGKSFLSLLLALVMVMGLLPVTSLTASAAESLATTAGTRKTLASAEYTLPAGSFTNVSYTVPSGVTATVVVTGTTTINNQAAGGSPFAVASGGTLNLIVNGTLTVYGQSAVNGTSANTTASAGGYAGIHVPVNGKLSVTGIGTLKAYGGDAGNGGDAPAEGWGSGGAGGGGGAGAGIGGNGGAGAPRGPSASGAAGESAGTISILGDVIVFAYGGGGGSGGRGTDRNGGPGGGAGGYPAAGIGGGGGGASGGTGNIGADGTSGIAENGNGGFSGGGATPNDSEPATAGGVNGAGALGKGAAATFNGAGGGGYFSKGGNANRYYGGRIGGGVAHRSNISQTQPDSTDGVFHGGNGGAGGTVEIVSVARIHAYNGSYITTSASGSAGNEWGSHPTPIYAQSGYSISAMRASDVLSVAARTKTALESELGNSYRSIAPSAYTAGGIGSGAGATEISNGSLEILALGPIQNPCVEYGGEGSSGDPHLNFVIHWDAPTNISEKTPLEQYKINESIYDYEGADNPKAANQPVRDPDNRALPNSAVPSVKNTAGYYYDYIIRGVNSMVGNNDENGVHFQITNPKVPAAATEFAVATRPDGQSITFTWTKPAGEIGATGYYIYYIPTASNTDVSALACSELITGTTATITLPEDRGTWDKYDFWVASVNGTNEGAAQPELSVAAGQTVYEAWTQKIADAYKTVKVSENVYRVGDLDVTRISNLISGERALTEPTAPREVIAATNNVTQQVKITWKAPEDAGTVNGGAAEIRGYRVYVQEHTDESGALREDAQATTLILSETNGVTQEGEIYTYVHAGLVDGQKYDVFVSALNGNPENSGEAESAAQIAADAATPRRVPDALKGLGAVSESSVSAEVTWNVPVKQANGHDETGGDPITGYTVTGYPKENPDAKTSVTFQTTDGGQTWTIAATNGTGMTISALKLNEDNTLTASVSGLSAQRDGGLPGNDYCFEVKATNGAGTGEEVVCEVTTLHAPSVVQVVEVVEDDRSVVLSWKAPEDSGTNGTGKDASVNGYAVFYKLTGGNENTHAWAFVTEEHYNAATDTWSYPLTGLDNGKSYDIEIHAFAGSAKWNNDTWRVVHDDITGFLGAAEVLQATPRRTPYAPVIGEVKTGDGQATIVTITAPENQSAVEPGNGGDEITSYKLYAVPVTLEAGTKLTNQTMSQEAVDAIMARVESGELTAEMHASKPVASYSAGQLVTELENVQVPNLNNGGDRTSDLRTGNYIVFVRAENEAGEGKASNGVFVRVGMPLAPTGLVGSLGNRMLVEADYKAAVGNGTAIQSYVLWAGSQEDASDAKIVNEGVDGLHSTFVADENGNELWIFIQADNGVGLSPLSKGVQVTVGAPVTPRINAASSNNSTVTVQWTSGANNGNQFDQFKVYYRQVHEDGTVDAAYTQAKTQGNVKLTENKYEFVTGAENSGFVVGNRYLIYVTACNVAGESPYSEPYELTVGGAGKPEITALVSSDNTLTATIAPPSMQDGDTLIKYNIYLNGSTEMYDDIVLSEDKKTVTIQNLSNGLNYTVTAEAETANGRGLMSDPVTGVPARKADQVTGVTAEPVSGNSIRVSWDAMSLSGGSAVTGYYITIYEKNGVDQCAFYEVDGATASFMNLDNTVLGADVFTANTTYQVGVQAITRINDTPVYGEQSARATVKTFSLPAAPKITSVISDCTDAAYQTVTVTWEAPEVMGDAPITGYVLYTNDWAYNGPNGSSGFDYYPADARSAELPNRALDETLEYKLAAVNMVGEGEKSEGVTYKVGDPAKPNITNVTLTDRGFKITWDAVGVGQADYQVSRYAVYLTNSLDEALGNSKSSQRVSDKSKASYSADIQVQPGQYYVWVSAENAYVEDAKLCASYVVVTVGGLSAPTGLTAVPDENTIQVSWNAIEKAQKYRVFYNDHVLEVTEPNAELNLSNNMIPGVEYRIRIAAVDKNGNQGVTCDPVYTHAWGSPVTPVISDLTPVESTFHFVHSASSCVGVSEPVEYRYLMRLSGSVNEFVQLTKGRDYREENGGITVSAIGGAALVQGREYTLVVRAWYNDKVQIDSVPATVTCGQPYAPTITNATPGSESLSIAFEPNDFGPAATGFLVYVRDGENKYYTPEGTKLDEMKGFPVSDGYHAMTFNRLTNKQTYYVTMTAVNNAGESQMSNQVAVTPGTAIAPKIASAVSGHGQVEISWLASSDTSVYQYNVYQDGVQVAQTGDTSIVIKNLKDGQQYRFQVTAVNLAGGESARSETVILSPGGKPGPVSGINWTLDEITPESQSAILYWNKPVEDGGLTVRYIVSGIGVPNGSILVDAAMCKITGLAKATDYTFTVTAVNDAGQSEAVMFTGTSAREPGAPAITSCVGVNGNISVTWNAPADNGRSTIKGYDVLVNDMQVNDTIITAMEYHFPGNDEIPLVVDMANSYKVQVRAVNEVGPGTPAQSTTSYYGMLAESVPNAPSITSVRARTSGKLNVEWSAPGYNGNNEITSYTLYYMEASKYNGSNLTSGTKLSFGKDARSTEISGLTDGVDYVIAIMATNGKGDSPLSTPYTMAPKAYLTPNAPEITGYSNNTSLTQMTLTWEYTPKAGDDLKTDFKVFVGVGSAQASATVQDTEFVSEDSATGTKTYQAVIPGLNAGQSHYISVSATNYLGDYGENQFGTAQSTGIRARVNLNVLNQNGELTAIDADMNGEEDHKVTITGPSAPKSAMVRSVGTEVTVTWSTPDEVGNGKGGYIMKYVLVKNGVSIDLPLGGTTAGFTENAGGEEGSYSYTFTGETNKGYTLEIYAVNNSDLIGTRTGSLFVFVSPSTPKPTGLTGELMSVTADTATVDLELAAKEPTHGTANADYAVELNWNTPTTGGEPVKVAGYRLYVAGVEAVPVNGETADLIPGDQTSCVYGLSSNQLNKGPLSFRVSAWYGEGDELIESGQSDAAMVSTATETDVPGKIVVTELNTVGADKLMLSWEPDSAATEYYLYKNGKFFMAVGYQTTNSVISTDSLEDGSVSIFQVSGVNGDGVEGEKSDAWSYYKPVNGEDPANLAAPELGIPVVDKVAQTLSLDWTAVEGADGYVVKFVKNGVTYTVDLTADGQTLTDTRLDIADYSTVICVDEMEPVDFSNAEFIIQVQAYQEKAAEVDLEEETEALAEAELAYGPVSVVAVSTLTEVPDAPQNFEAKAEENLTTAEETAMVYLTWDAPEFQGGNGAAVNGYTLVVYYRLPGETEQREETIPLDNVTSYEYTGKVNVDYSFVLTAHNAVVNSESEMATASARTTAADVKTVGAPTITGYLSNGSSLKIMWTEPTENPEDVAYYVVYVDGERIIDTKDTDNLWAIVPVNVGVRNIDVRAISTDIIASDPASIKARLALNMIDMGEATEDEDNALLIAATKPASSDPKDLDLDMDGVADQTGGGDVEDKVTVHVTVNADGGEDEITFFLYSNDLSKADILGDKDREQIIEQVKVDWTKDTSSFDIEFTKPVNAEARFQIVAYKAGSTVCVVNNVNLSQGVITLPEMTLYVGDLDGNGIVEGIDRALLNRNWLKNDATALDGDLDGNGIVEGIDRAMLTRNWVKEALLISAE